MWWLQQHQLGSKNPETRRKAAALLSEKPHRVPLRALASAARDSDSEVRRLCVVALGKLNDSSRLEPLIQALNDSNPQVLQAALTALRSTADPRVSPATVPLLRHPDAAVRGTAAQVLDAHRWQPQTEQDSVWLHVARGQFARAAAFGALAIPALETAIRHGPFSVALSAVKALGEIGGPLVLRPLVAALKSADGAVTIAALETLASAGFAESSASIVPLLKHRDAHVRLAAAEAMGAFRLREASTALLPLLGDRSWDVRRAAVEALGRVRDPSCVAPVSDALKDPDTDVREAAAVALASLGNATAIPALVCALGDPSSGVRRLAAAALTRIDENWSEAPAAKDTATELLASLPDRDADAAYFLRQVLNSRPAGNGPRARAFSRAESPILDPDQRRKLAATLFQNMLFDPDSLVRLAAVGALGRLKEPRSEGALVRALTDTDAAVRSAANRAIQSLRSD